MPKHPAVQPTEKSGLELTGKLHARPSSKGPTKPDFLPRLASQAPSSTSPARLTPHPAPATMHAMFEPSPYFLDPNSEPETFSSFLSFSSFADLDFTSALPSWNFFSPKSPRPAPASIASDTSSPSRSDPFEIIASAFDTPSPAGDIGIFHTPAKAGQSKLSGTASSLQTLSHRSSDSGEEWNTPETPSLTYKSSTDSFQSFATGTEFYLSPSRSVPFSWDDASSTLASSSYEPPTPTLHRTASNPSLGSSRLRPPAKPVVSMPALKEEDHVVSTPSQWFDGTEISPASPSRLLDPPSNGVDDVLVDNFDWVFGDFGLGEIVPTDSTIFAAFHGDHPTPADEQYGSVEVYDPQPSADMSWLPGPSTQYVSGMGNYDYPSAPFTINPISVMARNGVEEERPRPTSAPGLKRQEGHEQLLSVPTGGMMTRRSSVSSDAYSHSRHAPARDLFSYAPQQLPSILAAPQPLYTSKPSRSHYSGAPGQYLRTLPPTPSLASRRVQHGLSIQINPPNFSTYRSSPLPPTPQSASFGDLPNGQLLFRAGTQPLPTTAKLSAVDPSQIAHSPGMPAHLLRAQAIVQFQEAKEEVQRQELRRQVSARRVGMAEASVMQPHPQHRPRPTIVGWEGPSAQTGAMPVLTTTPLVNLHPPPAQYFLGSGPPTPHRVHPPPHPGTSRTISGLPSPSRRKPAKVSPPSPYKARSPAGKRKPASSGGAFSWGEATFINFTPDDADKLLTGVDPSGSRSKRKREEDALPDLEGEGGIVREDRERSKRSRSDE